MGNYSRAVNVPYIASPQCECGKASFRKPVLVVGDLLGCTVEKLLSISCACMSAAAVGRPDVIDCSNVHDPSLVTVEPKVFTTNTRVPAFALIQYKIDRTLEDHALGALKRSTHPVESPASTNERLAQDPRCVTNRV
jgi:hypothetical protein